MVDGLTWIKYMVQPMSYVKGLHVSVPVLLPPLPPPSLDWDTCSTWVWLQCSASHDSAELGYRAMHNDIESSVCERLVAKRWTCTGNHLL